MDFEIPFYLNLFGKSIQVHIIFETAAIFVGYRYYDYLRKKKGDLISESNRIWIFIAAALGALIGSRILGYLEMPLVSSWEDFSLLDVYKSKTIVGGLLFGLFTVEISKLLLGVKTSSGDLMTYPLILAMMIGRVGCFLTGTLEPTYGIETDFIFGMDLGDGIIRHPVALYEFMFLGALWFVLKTMQKHLTLTDGALFKLFLIAYFIFRIVIEFIKPAHFTSVGLSTIQIACVMGLFYYSKTFFQLPRSILQRPSK